MYNIEHNNIPCIAFCSTSNMMVLFLSSGPIKSAGFLLLKSTMLGSAPLDSNSLIVST